MRFLSTVNFYKQLPSDMLGLTDHYTAYCFNEAIAYIIKRLENGEEPIFKVEYKSFRDMYNDCT